jgi:hypothetical protein
MGKIVFWVVVVFAAMFALRLYNAGKARRRRDAAAATPKLAEAMVRCGRCGVFLPQPDARRDGAGYRCNDAACASAHPR